MKIIVPWSLRISATLLWLNLSSSSDKWNHFNESMTQCYWLESVPVTFPSPCHFSNPFNETLKLSDSRARRSAAMRAARWCSSTSGSSSSSWRPSATPSRCLTKIWSPTTSRLTTSRRQSWRSGSSSTRWEKNVLVTFIVHLTIVAVSSFSSPFEFQRSVTKVSARNSWPDFLSWSVGRDFCKGGCFPEPILFTFIFSNGMRSPDLKRFRCSGLTCVFFGKKKKILCHLVPFSAKVVGRKVYAASNRR